MRRFSIRLVLLLAVSFAVGLLLATYLVVTVPGHASEPGENEPVATEPDTKFDGRRAYDYLKQVVALGPRPSGSAGMRAQQKLLAAHFRAQGGKVSFQAFRHRHPIDGSTVPMANLFVQWHPQRKQRILLCAHYDTRPFPDRDKVNPRGRFVGANDGGSGVALLMELGHVAARLKGRYGIDFVLFDGEEFVFSDRDPYFVGSEYFARSYAGNPPSFRYRWGVLFDMVADTDLQLFQEVNSTRWRDTRPLVNDIWNVARQLGVTEFVARPKYEIRDDHLKLRQIGRIPTCDLIDFDYPWWHTEGDTPEHCSAESLDKVGRVIVAWLRQLK